MKLAENIVRINGWKNGKRTHIDVEVRTKENTLKWGKGKIIPAVHEEELVREGFKSGLDAVTSINYYNYVGDIRITAKV